MGPDMTAIGKLRNVSPREAWTHEALDFTPWLCENLGLLGEEIGIELEYESRETAVGSYFADIVARCPQDDRVVLIENQLERGNHQHLGQLMTYIAGTDAEIIVWIATDFSEPHLAAIKWLNEHTVAPFAFFAVRLRVLRIDDSNPAPMFEVLERPNTWERQMHAEQRERRSQSPRAAERLAYWELVLERMPEFEARGVIPNGSSSQWLTPDGVSNIVISIYMAVEGVGVFLRGRRGTTAAEILEAFSPHAQRFSEMVGGNVSVPTETAHPACNFKVDMTDRANWDAAVSWQLETAQKWLRAASEIFGDT